MSFISIIKGIGKGIEKVAGVAGSVAEPVIQLATPFVTILNPAAGAILGKIGSLVAGMETMVTTAQSGALKKQTVVQIAVAEIPQLAEVINQFGPNVKIPEAELSTAIDASVAGYNAIAALVAAIEAQNEAVAATTAKVIS
jgi:hypothetical protein